MVEIDEDLGGRRDVAILFHVEELKKDLLSNPGNVFAESEDGNEVAPVPLEEQPGGIGDDRGV